MVLRSPTLNRKPSSTNQQTDHAAAPAAVATAPSQLYTSKPGDTQLFYTNTTNNDVNVNNSTCNTLSQNDTIMTTRVSVSPIKIVRDLNNPWQVVPTKKRKRIITPAQSPEIITNNTNRFWPLVNNPDLNIKKK